MNDTEKVCPFCGEKHVGESCPCGAEIMAYDIPGSK